MPADPPDAGLRAVRHGRPPVRLRGRAGHRRPGPPAARGPGRHRGRGRRGPGSPTPTTGCSTACGPSSSRWPARFFDGLRSRRATTATSRPAPRSRLASLFRYAIGVAAARGLPGRVRPGRHAERGGRGPHRGPHPGHRGAHPPGRRHQAPGQDRHRRHLPLRRGAAPGRPWSRRCSPPAPPATGSATARCAPSPASTRSSRRSSATPATASRAGSRAPARRRPSSSSTAAASPATCRSAPTQPGCGAPSTGWPPSARCVTLARGRSDGRTVLIVPEVKDNQTTGLTLLHVRFADRPARPRCARCCRATAAATRPQGRRHRDRADLPRRPARRGRRRRAPDRAGLRPGRPLAHAAVRPRRERPVRPMIGIGVDLVELDRFRTVARPHARPRRPAVHRRTSGAYAERRDDPTERFAAASRPRRRC